MRENYGGITINILIRRKEAMRENDEGRPIQTRITRKKQTHKKKRKHSEREERKKRNKWECNCKQNTFTSAMENHYA